MTDTSVSEHTADDSGPGYSGKSAAQIVGITYRQLDYWARTDLLRPSMADASGSGSRRKYSYQDLLQLKLINTLLDAGIKLQQVRSVFTFLRENFEGPISSANLIISGKSVSWAVSDDELIDVLRGGQGVLNVLSMTSLRADLDSSLVRFERRAARPASAREVDGLPVAADG